MSGMDVLILGSGTSQGVPAIGCACATCMSDDPRDTRLRPSVCIRVHGKVFIIDLSSDFRAQMLRSGVTRIDAVLMTHHHFDHIGGFDDLRQFNVLQQRRIPVYGTRTTLDEMRRTFRYAFVPPMQQGGGVPDVEMIEIRENTSVAIHGVDVLPVRVMHGALPVIGYRIGPVAYVTDVNSIPDDAIPLLHGLDVLILDALRPLPHPTHFSLAEAVAAATRIGAHRTWFTHIAHDILHERDAAILPVGMAFAYDGLSIVPRMEAA